jgi:ribosomal protein S12 methylthiotransferase
MRRETSQQYIVDLLRKIRAGVPGIALRTTFIVGFPGETEEQFEELMEFAGEAAFDHAGAFIYSPEEGTSASRLRPRVPRRVALDRLNRLNAVLVARAESEHVRAADSILTVMVDTLEVEDYGGEVSAIARTAGQAPDVDGVTYIEGGIPRGLAPGDLVDVLIVGAVGFDLVGRLANA